MEWFKELEEEEQEAWTNMMKDHAYDEDEWNQARLQLHRLLKEESKQATEQATRSYLSCCAESSGSVHPLPDLSTIVEEFYRQYGMDNSNNLS